MKEGVVENVRAAGGEIYGITSEPQHLADQAREHWELSFESVGDPHQEISRVCSQRDWLTLFAADRLEFIQRGAKWKVEHPKGFFQPGVLAVTRERRILYRWRSVPSAENLNGTLSRPTATHVGENIERALAAGEAAGDAAHDDNPVMGLPPIPFPLFLACVLANGWFVRVKSFAYSPGVAGIRTRFATAAFRFVLFALAWISAFAWLPTVPVLLVLLAWVVWVGRDIRRVFGPLRTSRELTA